MQSSKLLITFILVGVVCSLSFRKDADHLNAYATLYNNRLKAFEDAQQELLTCAEGSDTGSEEELELLHECLQEARNKMKALDFWFRYLAPVAQKQINGPLPVEWETEVFEKHEKPYRREGAGLTLAYQELNQANPDKKQLVSVLRQSAPAIVVFRQDSITRSMQSFHHFFLCNRLYLLNLATIYTTGFECPNTESIIPELEFMLESVNELYKAYNQSFPNTQLPPAYLDLYEASIEFVKEQPADYEAFDHYHFVRDHINKLFALNQQLIRQYRVTSTSLVDYSLNKSASSIFFKGLFNGQNPKGIFLRVDNPHELAEIERIGKLLFHDPVLSGNNQRSCASCHNINQAFTDTTLRTSVAFNREGSLARNTPALLNAQYNHLLMADGKHYTLQNQTRGVITNAAEMGSDEKDILNKVLSCKDYRKAFKQMLRHTPQAKEITMDHVSSALTMYYSRFSKFSAPFDEAMNRHTEAEAAVQRGYNLFMSKATCATCHFAPQFNGVKPPYVGSEFEVLGVPEDKNYKSLSTDSGRYKVNPAPETLHAFRTGTLRNIAHTSPYMHNGVFNTLEEVIDFYDGGGGAGRGLKIDNQTLPTDSLHLTPAEKKDLIAFMHSLTENIVIDPAPVSLPLSSNKSLNQRKTGGTY